MPKCYVQKRAEEIGLPIVDGGAPVMVAVTEHDVVNAKKANSKHCALARASLRVVGVAAAYFFRTTAYLEYQDRMVRYSLPPSVQKEIVSFDRARMFAPGVYQLTPPSAARARPVTRAAYQQRVKRQRIEAKRSRRETQSSESASKRALGAKIEQIAARAPANDSPEQREFDRRISGIVGGNAPLALRPKRHLHRTQYVRNTNEPA